MPRLKTLLALSTLLVSVLAVLSTPIESAATDTNTARQERTDSGAFPWRDAGLSERQAAAHLLDRWTYGPRPGDVDRVLELGLETWFETQLTARLPEPRLREKLEPLGTLDLPLEKIVETYPNPGLVLNRARREGVIDADLQPGDSNGSDRNRRAMFEQVRRWAEQQGIRPQRELLAETMAQKLGRAVYAENQLREVLTDFWFNHFNVSITNNLARPLVLSYERDAIRPHVLGTFRDLLGATARHPAMLVYLDNARSTAEEGRPTTFDPRQMRRGRGGRGGSFGGQRGFGGQRPGSFGGSQAPRRGSREGDDEARQRRRSDGLNENYARELLELHTLGVDGGYSQDDVIEVARAFTGWSVLPPRIGRDGSQQRALERLSENPHRAARAGFHVDGLFLFRADAHDAAAKRVLGTTLPAGRGIEDGEDVLDLLADHASTGRHLAHKLAVRFVTDQPSPSLVERLASTFERSRGDLPTVLRTLVRSPEFWQARGSKIKSPLELAASTLRALDADVSHPQGTLEWVSRMGQPLYAYQAPTGYPDTADAWVNTGSLLNRMNFGLQLAAGRVDGVRLDLSALAASPAGEHREPESMQAALETYVPLLMPERDAEGTIALLTPVVQDPALADKVSGAAPEPSTDDPYAVDPELDNLLFGSSGRLASQSYAPPTPLEQVIGVILGSPEFQRR